MAKLDLKHFKKHSSDKHTTTLEDKRGHQIRLVHSALSPEMRSTLESLPSKEAKEGKKPKIEEKPKRNGELKKEVSQKNNYDEGGMIHEVSRGHYAAGGEVKDAVAQAKDISKDNPSAPITVNIGAQPAPTPDAEPAPPPVEGSQPIAAAPPVTAPQLTPTPSPQDAMAVPGQPPQSTAATDLAPKPVQPIAPAASQPGADPYGYQEKLDNLKTGFGEQKAGILLEGAALGKQADAQAAAAAGVANQLQKANESYKTNYDTLSAERDAFQKDVVNGHIDPNRYMSSMGTGGKISTAIGLILGGLGGGLTHQANPALEMLNKQIDRDIEAQKIELGKKENLLGANLKQFGNIRDATDMTRVMMNDIVSNQLKAAAARSGSDIAKWQALQHAGVLDQQSADVVQKGAMSKTVMGMINDSKSNPDQMGHAIQSLYQLDPTRAKQLEEHYIPGVGLANVAVDKETRDKVIGHDELLAGLTDINKFINSHSTLLPGTKDYAIGEQKVLALQSKIRDGQLRTVYKTGEQPLLDKFITSNPAGVFKYQAKAQIGELLRSVDRDYRVLKKNLGIETPKIQESAPILPK